MIGQPVGEGIDVGILADVSSRHAVIRRRQDDYVLEPLRAVAIDGRPLSGPALLPDRATIQLGDSVRLAFRRPHPLQQRRLPGRSPASIARPPCATACCWPATAWCWGRAGGTHVPCPGGSGEILALSAARPLVLPHKHEPLEIDGLATVGGGPLGDARRVFVSSGYSFQNA